MSLWLVYVSLQNLNTAVSIVAYDFGYYSIHESDSCDVLQYPLSHTILDTTVYMNPTLVAYCSIHESDFPYSVCVWLEVVNLSI